MQEKVGRFEFNGDPADSRIEKIEVNYDILTIYFSQPGVNHRLSPMQRDMLLGQEHAFNEQLIRTLINTFKLKSINHFDAEHPSVHVDDHGYKNNFHYHLVFPEPITFGQLRLVRKAIADLKHTKLQQGKLPFLGAIDADRLRAEMISLSKAQRSSDACPLVVAESFGFFAAPTNQVAQLPSRAIHCGYQSPPALGWMNNPNNGLLIQGLLAAPILLFCAIALCCLKYFSDQEQKNKHENKESGPKLKR